MRQITRRRETLLYVDKFVFTSKWANFGFDYKVLIDYGGGDVFIFSFYFVAFVDTTAVTARNELSSLKLHHWTQLLFRTVPLICHVCKMGNL
jgi:hypothetical protein